MGYLEKNKEEFDRLLDEILDEKVDIKIGNEDKLSNLLNNFFNREEAERLILERKGQELQKEFKEAIKKNPMFLEDINQRLDGKEEKVVEEEQREEKINERTEELAKQENLTKEEKENIKEEAKKDEKEITDENLKTLLTKAVYEHALDEYHNLREDLYTGQNGQVKTGELTNGEKMDTKLIMYERYIKKLDLQYKAYTGRLITEDDEKLKEKENKYFYRQQKNEKAVYEKTDKNLARIEELNKELDAIAEEISWRSANASLLSTQDFEVEMSKLQQMYADKVIELRSLDPDIVEMTRQLDAKENNDIIRDNLVGEDYERQKYKAGVIDTKNASLDEQTDNLEENITMDVNSQEKQMNEQLIFSVQEQLKMADSCFAKFEATGNIEDYNEAITHLNMAEQMSGITVTQVDEEYNYNKENLNEEIKEEDNKEKDKEKDLEDDTKDNMGLNRTVNEQTSNLKKSYRERKNNLEEKLNEISGRTQEDNTLVRKIN